MSADWWDKVNRDPEVIAQRSSEPPKQAVRSERHYWWYYLPFPRLRRWFAVRAMLRVIFGKSHD